MVLTIDGSSKTHSLDNLYPFGSICFVLLRNGFWCHIGKLIRIFSSNRPFVGVNMIQHLVFLNINKMRYPWGTHQHTSTWYSHVFAVSSTIFFRKNMKHYPRSSQSTSTSRDAPWIWQPRLLIFFLENPKTIENPETNDFLYDFIWFQCSEFSCLGFHLFSGFTGFHDDDPWDLVGKGHLAAEISFCGRLVAKSQPLLRMVLFTKQLTIFLIPSGNLT